MVRRKGLAAAGALGIVLAGCGGAVRLQASSPTTLPAPTTSPVKVISSHYCRRQSTGIWVTDDTVQSTTRCVPDPSYATGDDAIDGSAPVPRCLTCSLADWKRAEKRAAEVLASPGTGTTTAEAAKPSQWPASVTDEYVYSCETTGGQEASCQCIAGQLEQQVAPGNVAGLSAYDPRVEAAERSCPSSTR